MRIAEADLETIHDIAKLFDDYRVWYQQQSDLIASEQFLMDRIRNRESIIYVASVGDEAVGFTQLYPLFSSTRLARIWLLNDLYVTPEYRGQGISIQLIERAKELARETGAAGLSLETEKNNLIGNHLYPRTDFEVDTEHFFYFWTNPEFHHR